MKVSTLTRIRNLLWLYFWLLIFEGALRKWILPGLSNPLLLIRDPIAIYALILGWPLLRRQPWIGWIQPLFGIAIAGFLLAITVGHGDIFVALYGARIILLHLPLIFLFPLVFDRHDVVRFGWILLFLSIPHTVLMVAQSNSADTHILNVMPGGVGSAAFDGALGRSRPPGLFSFITGVVSFYTLTLSLLFSLIYGLKANLYAKVIFSMAAIAMVVALPVSISRGMLASYLMVFTGLLLSLLLARIPLGRLLTGIAAIAAAVYFGTMIPAFQDTSVAFIARWEGAGAVAGNDRSTEGDIGIASGQLSGRVLPGYLRPLQALDHVPILGHGLGLGTNVGAQRITGQGFALGEGAWENTLGELGPFLGLLFIGWRIALAFHLLRLSLDAAKRKNIIPLIILGGCFQPIISEQIGTPTALGFLVLSTGLAFASLRTDIKTV